MTFHTMSATRRAIQRLGASLVIVLVSLAGLSIGAPVSADTGFSGSTPSDGDVVAEPVTLVTLVFSAVAEPLGDGFVVLDATGQTRVPTEVSTLDSKVYTLTFDPPLAGGEIGVKWSVAGADAHPLEGAFSFTVSAPAPESTTTLPAAAQTAPSDAVDAGGDMSQMSAQDMASMDDFLAVETSRPGESLATLGRLMSLAGIALAIGGIAFAATTLRGQATEIETLVGGVRILGGVVAVGAVVEYLGVTRISGESFVGYWSSSPGFATILRLLAGVAIAAGLAATTVGRGAPRPLRPLSSAPNTTDALDRVDDFWALADEPSRRQSETRRPPSTDRRDDANGMRGAQNGPVRRWVPDRSSAWAFAGCGLAVMSFWFDGHTVSKGFRPLHAVANSVHVIAGSVWVGGVVVMAVVLWSRHRRGVASRASELVVRFSSVATVALGAVVVAGLVMAVSVLDSFGGLTGTEWGQVLLLKTGAAGLAIIGGAYNHFRLLPALEADPDDPILHEQIRSVVSAEAIMLGFVVVVTAWLVASAS